MSLKIATRDKLSEWSKTFPTEISSQKKAAVFMKKLFAVAISNCLYIRNIFPEHAFFNKTLDGLNLKILKEDGNCSGATKVISWMRSCFDAFEKRFLKTVIIGLYKNPDDPDTVVESYTFEFKYMDDDIQLDVTKEGESNLSTSHKVVPMEDIKSATVSLLKVLFDTGNTLGKISGNLLLSMKLLYYDEVTPEDYEPPGFKPCNSAEYQFQNEYNDQFVGSVETHLHSFKMNMQYEKECPIPFSDDPMIHDTKTNPSPISIESLTYKANTPASARALNSDTPGSNARSFVANVDEYPVRCPCGVKNDYGTMVLCEVCKNWLHSVCIGIIDDENVPTMIICDLCADSYPEMTKNMRADKILLDMKVEDRQMWCLIRRSLFITPALKNLQAGLLAKELDVEIGVCQMIWRQLENDGAFIKSKGKKQNKAIDKKRIINILVPKYFGNVDKNAENMDLEMVSDDPANANMGPWGDENKLKVSKLEEKAANLTIGDKYKNRKRKRQPEKGKSDEEISNIIPNDAKLAKYSHEANTPIQVKKSINKK